MSGLSNLYNLNNNSSNVYSFITDCGNEYFLTFSDLSGILELSELRIYEFGIGEGKRVSRQNDHTKGKLRDTVVAALKRLFAKEPNCAVLIILDSVDGKQKARHRMFLSDRADSWFSTCGENKYALTKLPVEATDFKSMAFILLTKANANAALIAEAAKAYVDASFGSLSETV